MVDISKQITLIANSIDHSKIEREVIRNKVDKIHSEMLDDTQSIYIPEYSTSKHNKHILVISGGGIKGIAFLGAIQALSERNLLCDIHTYAGTSIGSLIVLMLNIGYTPLELFDFIMKFDLGKIKSLNFASFMTSYGIDNCLKVENTIKSLMTAKNIPESITFKQLYELTNKKLIMTSVNVNKRQAEYFSVTSHPDMLVALAARMSISIPFLFTPIIYNDCYYVDGGCIDNFPYKQFINDIDNIIGLYITEPHCIKREIVSLETYAIYVMLSVLYGFEQFVDKTRKNIIQIEIGKITSISFNLKPAEKTKLYEIGYNKLKDWIF